MADDLDENFVLEENFKPDGRSRAHESDDEEEEETTDNRTTSSSKRPAPVAKSRGASLGDEAASAKKRKRLNITEILELKKDELNRPDYCVNEFKQLLLKHMDKSFSNVERIDLNLHADADAGCTTSDKLSKYLIKRAKTSVSQSAAQQIGEKFSPKFAKFLKKKKMSAKKARPYAVVLCSSAVRCIQLQKELDETCAQLKNKSLKWIHAFAKHKKLNEQIDYIQKRADPIHLVFATPQRFAQLVQTDAKALKLAALRYCVVDYNHRDCKQKRLVDIPEIKADFVSLLFTHLLPLNREKAKLKFYLA